MGVVRRARPSPMAARLLGAAMTGVEEAIYGPKEERPGIYQDANGDPPGDQPFELLLDPEHPERSMVIFHAPAADEVVPEAGSGAELG